MYATPCNIELGHNDTQLDFLFACAHRHVKSILYPCRENPVTSSLIGWAHIILIESDPDSPV